MLRPILLTSAKVPNDLEIYPTFNVEQNTQVRFKEVELRKDNAVGINWVSTTGNEWGWDTYIFPSDTTNYSYREFAIRSQEQESDFNRSILLIERKLESNLYEVHYIATQDWVNEQISGAIAASY